MYTIEHDPRRCGRLCRRIVCSGLRGPVRHLAKRPSERGAARCAAVFAAPADSPKIVTCAGSMPRPAAFRLTHRNASRWSCSPQFPVELSVPSRRREFCHFADTSFPIHIETPTKGRGGCSRTTVSPTAIRTAEGILRSPGTSKSTVQLVTQAGVLTGRREQSWGKRRTQRPIT